MKDVNVLPYNQAGFEQLKANLEAGILSVIGGKGDIPKDHYHTTIKPDGVLFQSKIEGDDWSAEVKLADSSETVHVRGAKFDGNDCLVFWRGGFGKAHHDLAILKDLLKQLLTDKTIPGFAIKVTDSAWLTGWMVKENDDYIDLIQNPTWTKPGETITGRTPYDLETLNNVDSEIFINNIWFNISRKGDGYNAHYNERENTFYVTRTFDQPVELIYDELPAIELGAYEEVNYESPVMQELGLLPPGQTKPDLIYNGADGRQVVVIKEVFDASTYMTYVFGHGSTGQHDQITLGKEAAHNEQLIEALIHRYTALNDEVPHEANVKTIELLNEIKTVQASRYTQREEDGTLGSKVVIAGEVPEADLPRDAEGSVADLTPAQ